MISRPARVISFFSFANFQNENSPSESDDRTVHLTTNLEPEFPVRVLDCCMEFRKLRQDKRLTNLTRYPQLLIQDQLYGPVKYCPFCGSKVKQV